MSAEISAPVRFESFADELGRIKLADVVRKKILPCGRRTLTRWILELPPGRRLKVERLSRRTVYTRPQWLHNFVAAQGKTQF